MITIMKKLTKNKFRQNIYYNKWQKIQVMIIDKVQ